MTQGQALQRSTVGSSDNVRGARHLQTRHKRPGGLTVWRRRQARGLAVPLPAIFYVLFAFALPIIYNIMLSFELTSPGDDSRSDRPVCRARKLPLHP